jgi:hypothetical protein
MLPTSICTAAAVLIGSTALAQGVESARGLLRPINGNLNERVIRIDPATGQMQRLPASTIGNDGKFTVYDNTCPTGYYVGLNTMNRNGPSSNAPMAFGEWGGLPSTAAATSATCTPGLSDVYDITQFVFGYCTSDGVALDMVFHFWQAPQNACITPQPAGTLISNGAPTIADITIVGLPRSSVASPTPSCYAIQVTLGTPGFAIDGGTAGLRDLALAGDRFAWSMQVLNGTGGAGPALAGNALLGSPCTFCAGTVWEVGGQTTSPGIGLGQSNVMFLESYGGTTPNSGDCYWFGGNPWAGGFLTLDAHFPVRSFSFCDGNDGSLASCPCGNPGAPDAGCDNAQSTGGVQINLVNQVTSPSNGATLTGTGFSTMGAPTSIVLRSNALDPRAPVVVGDGLRCVNTHPLVRLAATTAVAGTATHTIGHGAMAGTGTFFYQLWYRNTPSTFCDPFAAFNLSNGTDATWP